MHFVPVALLLLFAATFLAIWLAERYQASRGLTHLRLGFRDRDGGWEVIGWVRNLFDKHYLAAIYALTGTGDYGAVVGDPRSYGLTLRLAFE